MSNLPVSMEQQIRRAKTKPFRFKPGQSGNPSGMSRVYFECRKIAQDAAPDVMRELIKIALGDGDERTRLVAQIALLDRSGLKPIEHAELLEQMARAKKAQGSGFDPSRFTPEELRQIEDTLRLISQRNAEIEGVEYGDVDEAQIDQIISNGAPINGG